MELIKYDDWKKLDLRVGIIKRIEKVENSNKLYKMIVDVGEKDVQIVSSLVDYYKEEELSGKRIIVLTNLKPAKFRGEISEGMLLCAEKDDESQCVLLSPEKPIEPGTRVT